MFFLENRPRRPAARDVHRRAPAGFEGGFAAGALGAGGWPPAPPGAKYPLAHLQPEHVEPESIRMMSEVLKALRPHREALEAVRARFAELFRKSP